MVQWTYNYEFYFILKIRKFVFILCKAPKQELS